MSQKLHREQQQNGISKYRTRKGMAVRFSKKVSISVTLQRTKSCASKVKLLSRATLCDPMDCSPPGSSVHGIVQAKVQEWVAISFSRGSSRTQGMHPGLPHCRQIILLSEPTWEVLCVSFTKHLLSSLCNPLSTAEKDPGFLNQQSSVSRKAVKRSPR